ncbi:hypothetical protein MXAN_7434 [Myxococcus xanthus DK 1622]|uniref:Uncharacterized protein n=1 Tax=Myxococcus xanthus (strain DK1622) TaxID=246197 RepID=Q1CVN4_MYXXD|nr:hypothetical protein MXAN_7434 [Myxococcus xanthus DK 1622]
MMPFVSQTPLIQVVMELFLPDREASSQRASALGAPLAEASVLFAAGLDSVP